MAKFLPIKYKAKEERYTHVKLKKGELTDKDIREFIGTPYDSWRLSSGDLMYYNELSQEKQIVVNEIATSILGRKVYGPVLLVEAKELQD